MVPLVDAILGLDLMYRYVVLVVNKAFVPLIWLYEIDSGETEGKLGWWRRTKTPRHALCGACAVLKDSFAGEP